MRWFNRLLLARKMMVMAMATTLLGLLVMGILFAAWDLRTLRTRAQEDLQSRGEALAANCAAPLVFDDASAAAEQLATLRFDLDIEAASLFDAQGRRVALFARDAQPPVSEAPLHTDGMVYSAYSLDAVLPVTLKGERVGTLVLRHGLDFVAAEKRALAWTLAVAATAALLASLFFIARLQRAVSAPILRLAAAAQDVTQRGDCSVRVPAGDGAETGILTQAFNEMLSRIEAHETELRAHRDNLEQLVQQRTAELRDVNRQLTESMTQVTAAAVAKSQFLANMSHEIRTPMNGVIGMTSLLMQTPLDGDQREMAQTVMDSADGLLRIINDVLDYSKLEAGRLALESIDFDMRTVLESVCDLIQPVAAPKGLELVCLEGRGVRTAVRGDPSRLRQILLNLLNNAVKFTESGEVVVRLTQDSEADGHVVLRTEVQDSGIGIPPEGLSRLFKTFSQVDASTTRRFGGTGLGLAISRQLVQAMGGQIGVRSEPGKGSTFWFTVRLPVQPDVATAAEPLPEALAGLRVLVVDDNETNRRVLQGYLETWGLPATAVAGGASALAELRAAALTPRAYGLVLLDKNMPDTDGEDVARAIRADEALRAARVVILTSSWERREAAAWQAMGVSGHLTKPVKPGQLLKCLSLVMGQPAENSPAATVTEETVSHAEERARLRILLVEDNAVNQKVAAAVLRKGGWRCDVVDDGEQAVERVERQRYDVVLMDCQMPRMDGFEATRRIREWEARQPAGAPRLPILAMTANALGGDRERCLEAGMDDYVSKPVKPDALYALLERWMPAPADARPAAVAPHA